MAKKLTRRTKKKLLVTGHEISLGIFEGKKISGEYENYKVEKFHAGKRFVEECLGPHKPMHATESEEDESRPFRAVFLEKTGKKKESNTIAKLATYSVSSKLGSKFFSSAPVTHHRINANSAARKADVHFEYLDVGCALNGHLDDSISNADFVIHLSANAEPGEKQQRLLCDMLVKKFSSARKNKVVIFSASSLERMGIPCTVNSSSEQFANELRRHMESSGSANTSRNRLVNVLKKSSCVLIRHRVNSAVAVFTADNQLELKLINVSNKNLKSQPNLYGFTSILSASIARELLNSSKPFENVLIEGINRGLYRCVNFANEGYERNGEFNTEWHKELFSSEIKLPADLPPPICIPENENWSIAKERIDPFGRSSAIPITRRPKSEKRIAEKRNAVECGMTIVKEGLEAAESKYGIPFGRFGDVSIVDRSELEGFLQVQLAMNAYINNTVKNQPLSLAVFGPPGSGKSFGVKQVAENLGQGKDVIEFIDANVSQFSSYGDLVNTLHQARDITLSGKIPIVFFDEFDSSLGGQPFGWLKYLLAPMQDGKFRQGESMYNTGKAIFLFVGGVNHSFEMMDGRLRNHEFIEAKGPDFVSRLKGYMNVLGIERTGEDVAYILRRAVLVRSILERFQPAIFDRDFKNARIDNELLHPLLVVDKFKHGVRSLEAIVRMCRLEKGQTTLRWTSLPQTDQLDMHVDARAFETAIE